MTVMLLFVAGQTVLAGAANDSGTPAKEGYEVVAIFPVGTGEFDATVVDMAGNGVVGPEAFWVMDDGQVLLLDSQRNRILVNEYGWVQKAMSLEADWPRDLVVRGNRIFVLDGGTPQVLLLDLSGALVQTLPLPAGALDEGVGRLRVTPGGRVAFDGDGTSEIDLETGRKDFGLSRHDGQRSTITVESGKATLAYGQVKTEFAFPGRGGSARQIDTDVHRNSIVEVAGVRGQVLGRLSVDLTVRKVDRNGLEVGLFAVPLDEYITFPNRFAQVTRQGEIYIMVIASDRVEIRRLFLGEGRVQPGGDTPSLPPDSSSLGDVGSSATIMSGATVDRLNALWRADGCIDQYWDYNTANGQHSSRTDVKKPDYLVPVPYGTLMNGSLSGIPYCWGGYDSVYTSSTPSTWSTFSDAMMQGYLAGNILATGTYKAGTAGTDCSGWVASNVGWGYPRPDGWGIRGQSYLIPADLLETMDVLNDAHSHILHFVGFSGIGNVATKECTTGFASGQPHEKTKNFTRTWAWLATNGYEPRTFWPVQFYGTDFAKAAQLPTQNQVGGYTNQGEKLWFKFYANAGQAMTVTLQPDYNDSNLAVYNPSQTLVGTSSKTGLTADTVSFTASVAGYFRARVTGVVNSAWKLSVSSTLDGSTFEKANTYSVPVSGNTATGQYQYYKFAANAGEQVTVTLHTTSGDQDLYVYDPNRVQLGFSTLTWSYDDVVTFLANNTVDGINTFYYVKVHGFLGGGYDLSIQRTPTSGDIVLSGGILRGSVALGQDAYYRFHAASGVTFTLTVLSDDGSFVREVHVYDPAGTEVWAGYTSGISKLTCSYTALLGGTYRVMVRGSGTFQISVAFTQQ